MKIAVMQPYLFPYIGYLQLMAAVDHFVFFDDVNFIKKGWINRNRILLDGQEHMFSVSLEKVSQNKKINETFLFEPQNTRSAFYQLIERAYQKAPFAGEWLPKIKSWVVDAKDNRISHFNGEILENLARELGLKTKFHYSSAIPGHEGLKGQEKILAITQALGGTHYINASGGAELYSAEAFAKRNVKLSFIGTPKFEYAQLNRSEFLPYLSILDVLANVPKSDVIVKLNGFELHAADPVQVTEL